MRTKELLFAALHQLPRVISSSWDRIFFARGNISFFFLVGVMLDEFLQDLCTTAELFAGRISPE